MELRRIKKLPFLLALGLTTLLFRPSDAYEIITVAEGAAIKGKVAFKGKTPKPKKILITKDKAVCGKGYVERKQISVSQNGALNDVVVIVEGITKGKPWKVPKGGYVLDQRKCEFQPYLQVIPKGSELLILNSDPVLHNIHTYELIGRARRTLFNIAQPKFKPKVTRTVKTRRGKTVRVECDAHNWMLGWLYVVDNPYYAIVGKDGSFSIQDIPAGTYMLKAWHPLLGIKEKKVSVSVNGKVEANFEFSE
jgi:hypothetical protein